MVYFITFGLLFKPQQCPITLYPLTETVVIPGRLVKFLF